MVLFCFGSGHDGGFIFSALMKRLLGFILSHCCSVEGERMACGLKLPISTLNADGTF